MRLVALLLFICVLPTICHSETQLACRDACLGKFAPDRRACLDIPMGLNMKGREPCETAAAAKVENCKADCNRRGEAIKARFCKPNCGASSLKVNECAKYVHNAAVRASCEEGKDWNKESTICTRGCNGDLDLETSP